MSAPSPTTGAIVPDMARVARTFRYVYRVPLLLWHLLVPPPMRGPPRTRRSARASPAIRAAE